MKFKLKRKEGSPSDTFSKDEYKVHENKNDNHYDYKVISDSGTPYYFNIKDGKVERDAYLEASYWEVVEIKEENIVEKFKLKRKEGKPSFRFSYKEYDVHRSLSNSKWGYAFYVLDDKGEKYYFNMLDGQIDNSDGHLEATNWEVIRIKEEKKMNKFNVGETYLCTKAGDAFTAGNLYKVHDDLTAPEPYILSDQNLKWFKHDLKDIYSEFVKLIDAPEITAQTLSVENTKIMIDAEKLRAHIMKLGLDGSQITSYLTGYIQAAKGEM